MGQLKDTIVSGNLRVTDSILTGNIQTTSATFTGQVHINYDQDVGLDQNGSLIIGSKIGENIGIDGNEIMARNNSGTSTLHLNYSGGNIIMNGSNSTGNVGIGTITPAVKLSISGGLAVIDDSANTTYDALGYFRSYSNNNWGIIIDKSQNYTYGLLIRAGGNYALKVESGSSRFLGSIIVGADGVPSYTLDVRGNIALGGPSSHGSIGCVYGSNDSNRYNYIDFYSSQHTDGGGIVYVAGKWTSTNHIAHRFEVSSVTNALVIRNTSGAVGIGVDSPAVKLDVNGDIRAQGNNVYIGSSSGSRCHEQYDTTNKCLKFIFD